MNEHGAGALVLIADDSVDNRDVYVMVLESRGYRVDVASDGAEAITKAVDLCPAIIIMDLAMPIIDGWTACRRLKDDKRAAGIPVIVLSAHVMKGEEERVKAAGCDAYLPKPCLPETLVAEVERHLARVAVSTSDARQSLPPCGM
jgi:two-component system cell cycle response regulator DivK